MNTEASSKNCPDCGHVMWIVDIAGHGTFWQCNSCRQTVDESRNRFEWYKPSTRGNRGLTKERKYRSHEPCPRCGESLWVIEVPNYGSRQQCENCRISIVQGAILPWKGAPKP